MAEKKRRHPMPVIAVPESATITNVALGKTPPLFTYGCQVAARTVGVGLRGGSLGVKFAARNEQGDDMAEKTLTKEELRLGRALFDRITEPSPKAGDKNYPSPPYPPVIFKGTVDGSGCDL